MADQPLPSWSDGPAKTAILDFVARVTAEGGPDYVPPPERIATFDNDGTLWCEQPLQNQFFFAFDRLEALATKDPSLRERLAFKAFLLRDAAAIHALGKQAAFEVAFAVQAGMTADQFAAIASEWFATARHPKLKRPYAECVYQPQLELLAYLRTHGFKTFIVSGGGIDLIRAFAEDNYGIPPEQVIGSSFKLRFEADGDRANLLRLSEFNSFDDREVKPANIGLHIGRRPILAFGNSDGDLAMLRYTPAGEGSRLGLLLHHDDAEREFAYDREFRLSALVEALDKADAYGITVVSMKAAWSTVFPEAAEQRTSSWSQPEEPMREWLVIVTEYAILLIDAMALAIVLFGALEAFIAGFRLMLAGTATNMERREVWLRYARVLVAGLTFQLAADIIETLITTGWEAVARLGAIAVIRTFLNFFLERDLTEIRELQHERTRERAQETRGALE